MEKYCSFLVFQSGSQSRMKMKLFRWLYLTQKAEPRGRQFTRKVFYFVRIYLFNFWDLSDKKANVLFHLSLFQELIIKFKEILFFLIAVNSTETVFLSVQSKHYFVNRIYMTAFLYLIKEGVVLFIMFVYWFVCWYLVCWLGNTSQGISSNYIYAKLI